jgi:hypothetical protein
MDDPRRGRVARAVTRRAAAAALAATACAAALAPGARAQDTTAVLREAATEGWNAPAALELAARAIARRRAVFRDTALHDYRARATGHVYFLFDLGPGTARTLVKADQLALDLYWRAPGETRQVIVGHRERAFLPTDIHYHVDHLTVVMDNFGDRIRLGEGNEVQHALHPAAPSALAFYDYRLADSLTLRLPDDSVRVVAVEVRPKDVSAAGIVGTVFLDRRTADIVRMDFTFTKASYLDPHLQYIRIVLENALWARRYWLPYRQGLELRREARWLDFPAGGVIRAQFRIGGYRFNEGAPGEVFLGGPVQARPRAARRAFPFDEELYAGLEPEARSWDLDLRAVEARAVELVAARALDGLAGRPRLLASGASSLLRYRRAEGVYAGLGASLDLGRARVDAEGGRAWGAGRWQGRWRLEVAAGRARLGAEGYADRVADVAPWPAAPGAIQTLGAALSGEDYAEPYVVSGAALGAAAATGGLEWEVRLRRERQAPAGLAASETFADGGFRPVRAVRAGWVTGASVRVASSMPVAFGPVSGLRWAAHVEGWTGELEYGRAVARVSRTRWWPEREWRLELALQAGHAFGGDLPPQALFPVGGRGTVRGYPFHAFAGDRYVAASAEISFPLRSPWLRLHAFGDVAWADATARGRRALAEWNADAAGTEAAGPTRGLRPAAGAGVGFLYDVLRVETARGLRDGRWEWIVTVHPALWPWL